MQPPPPPPPAAPPYAYPQQQQRQAGAQQQQPGAHLLQPAAPLMPPPPPLAPSTTAMTQPSRQPYAAPPAILAPQRPAAPLLGASERSGARESGSELGKRTKRSPFHSPSFFFDIVRRRFFLSLPSSSSPSISHLHRHDSLALASIQSNPQAARTVPLSSSSSSRSCRGSTRRAIWARRRGSRTCRRRRLRPALPLPLLPLLLLRLRRRERSSSRGHPSSSLRRRCCSR